MTQVRSESMGQSKLIKRSGHESMKGGREKERVIVYKSYVELFVYKIQLTTFTFGPAQSCKFKR